MKPLPISGQAPPPQTGRRAGGLLALSFPWLVFVFVTGVIAWDWMATRDAVDVTGAVGNVPTAVEDEGPVAHDVVCGMDVRKHTAYRVTVSDANYYFCSQFCRDEVASDPGRWISAGLSSRHEKGSHVMRGIPSWMYQVGIGLVLLVSFGLFELMSWVRLRRGEEDSAMDARWDLTRASWVQRLLKGPMLRFAIQAFLVFMFVGTIAAGLFGNQNPALNIAPLLTWTIWWAGLMFLILYFGKLWCSVCPWDAMATWLERLKFWGKREDGLGLGLRWPRKLKNIWPAVVLFVLLTWVELGMGVTNVPRVTAYLALAMLGMAVASALIFDRKAFCRYGCLVGRVSGLYALFSPVELRSTDPATCAGCKTMDCYKGNAKGDGCPTFEFPRTMSRNTYCILCTDCIKTCPHDNIAIRARPWGADLVQGGKARADEAILALILLSMTGFHGLTMTPRWAEWSGQFEAALGLGHVPSFTILMTAILVVPIAVYWALAKLAALAGGLPTRTVFLHYAYSLLPIALFYHLAHNAEHFLMEGPKIVALASDPFGWGWNLFGTAGMTMPPLVTLEGLWILQVFFVLIGHLYGLWIAEKTSRRLISSRWRSFVAQLPMLAAMILSSVISLWLLSQPMEIRISAM